MRNLLILLVLVSFATVGLSQLCGSTGKRCVKGRSVCVANTSCDCDSPFTEHFIGPGFQCYRKNKVAAEVANDPTLSNMNKEKIKFPYTCRYLLTHFKNNLITFDKDVIGTCEVMVHGFNAKSLGKHFMHGFDMALRITYDNGTVLEITARKYGVAKTGNLVVHHKGEFGVFKEYGTMGYDPIEYHDPVNEVKVSEYFNKFNDEVGIDASRCGFKIVLRPYDIELRQSQEIVPGLSVAVNCVHEPMFFSNDRVLATAPVDAHGGLSFKSSDYLIGNLTAAQTNIVRAYASDVAQTQPGATLECENGKDAFAQCDEDELLSAFENCEWMITSPLFIKCYDPSLNGHITLEVFHLCVRGWCEHKSHCHQAMSLIDMSVKCKGRKPKLDVKVPEYSQFLSGDLCPP